MPLKLSRKTKVGAVAGPSTMLPIRLKSGTLDKLWTLKLATKTTMAAVIVHLIEAEYRGQFGDRAPKPKPRKKGKKRG